MTQPGKTKLRGRTPLILAVILGVIGIVLISIGAVVLANGSFGKIDDFKRVNLSDSAQTVDFTRAGKYVGYFETPTNGSHRADVRLAIGNTDRNEVKISLYDSSRLTYTDGGRFGEALYTFSIPKAGSYVVVARSTNAPPGAGLAFGESIAGNLVTGLVVVLPGIGLVIAAIVLLVIGLVKRGRHKKELETYWAGSRGP